MHKKYVLMEIKDDAQLKWFSDEMFPKKWSGSIRLYDENAV